MSALRERISYLKGLSEGLKVDDTTKEGRILQNMMGVLEEMADSIAQLELAQREADEYMDAISEDLGDLEDWIYGTVDESPEWEEDEEGEEGDEVIEVTCPNCGEQIWVDTEAVQDGLEAVCPNCNEVINRDDNQLNGKTSPARTTKVGPHDYSYFE